VLDEVSTIFVWCEVTVEEVAVVGEWLLTLADRGIGGDVLMDGERTCTE
jgi:hypothetical protein